MIPCNERHLLLLNVRYSPNVTDTLLSIDQLWEEMQCDVRFRDLRRVEMHADSASPTLFKFVKENGSFVWKLKRAKYDVGRCFAAGMPRPRATSHLNNLPADMAAAVLHRRLHLGEDIIKRLPALTADAPESVSSCPRQACGHCAEANATRLPHSGQAYKPSYPGRLVHGDMQRRSRSRPRLHRSWRPPVLAPDVPS